MKRLCLSFWCSLLGCCLLLWCGSLLCRCGLLCCRRLLCCLGCGGGSCGLGDATRLGLAEDTRYLLLDGRCWGGLAGLACVGLGLRSRLSGGGGGGRLLGAADGLLGNSRSLGCGGLGLLQNASVEGQRIRCVRHTVVVAFLVAGAFSAVFFSTLGSAFLVAVAVTGLASFLASFTGPELPVRRVSYIGSFWHGVKTRRRTRELRCGIEGGTHPWDAQSHPSPRQTRWHG
jgi:hypothetical protein